VDDGVEGPAGEAEGPLERRAWLRTVLPLVERMAGGPEMPPEKAGQLEARAQAYAAAAPIARRRFDALTAEAVASAAAGMTALVRHRTATGRDCAPAAEELAVAIRRALIAIHRLAPIP